MRRRRSASPALLAAAALFLSAAASLHAQGTRFGATLDAGHSSVRWDEYLRSDAITVSPAARLDLPRGSVNGRATWSRFPSGNVSLQGILGGSVLHRFGPRVVGEIGATGSSTYYNGLEEIQTGGDRAGSLYGGGRLHFSSEGRGFWLGGAGGAVTDGYERRSLWQAEAAAWAVWRDATFSVAARPTGLGAVRFVDGELAARWWWRARLELSGLTGLRAGDEVIGARTWSELNVAAWLTPHVAILGGVGRYPADVAQGVPGARYATVAMRLASRPPPRLEAGAPRPAARPTAPLALIRALPSGDLTARLTADGRVLLRVRAPEAGTVELMGDFTDWEPVPLRRTDDGAWEGIFPLVPGTYRFNVRRDGGPWEVPTGVPALEDDLGGTSGVLVIG